MKQIEIPAGFIKSEFYLNFLHWKNLELFEKHILRILIRDFELYYSKSKSTPTNMLTVIFKINFYCRKKDELNIIYYLGIYYNGLFNSQSKEEIINSNHCVEKDYLSKMLLKRK